jgi:hypothetical protein
MKPLTVEQLREKAAQGLALNAEGAARVAADDERVREEQREAAKAKRVTEFLNLEPTLRAEASEAQSELRSLVAAIVPAIERAREAQAKHEAVARQLRHDGERCPQIPSLKVQGINDRALFHDLDKLRFYVQSDW